MVYPGSTVEFRIFVKQDGTQEFQLRYVNSVQSYTGKWQAVPVVKEVSIDNI
jgi:hypothetical protein